MVSKSIVKTYDHEPLHQIHRIDLDVDRPQVAAVGFGVGEGDVERFAKRAAADAFEDDLQPKFVFQVAIAKPVPARARGMPGRICGVEGTPENVCVL